MLTLQLLPTTPVKSPVYRMDFSMLIIISSGSVNDLGLKMFCELKKFLYVESQLRQCFDILIKNSSVFVHLILVSFMGTFYQKRTKSGWTFNYNTSFQPTKLIVPTHRMVSQI